MQLKNAVRTSKCGRRFAFSFACETRAVAPKLPLPMRQNDDIPNATNNHATRHNTRERNLSMVVDARESLRDIDTFASQCALWKKRGVDIVLPFEPQNFNTYVALRHALELCAHYQLKVWLRVEYANAGANIEYSMSQSYVTYQTFDVSRGALALFDRVKEVVSAVAVAKVESDFPLAAPRLVWSKTRDITADFATHAARGFRDLTDDWGQARLYLWARETENRFDALDANATQNVISSTRSALETLFEAPEIRAAIRGIILDAPSLWNENVPDALRRFPYHNDLPRVFEALHGTDLQSALPSLIADTGSDAVRVRLDFWTGVTQMLRDNFARPWREFADENALQLRLDFIDDNLNHSVARYGDIAQLAQIADCCALKIDNITSGTRCLLRLLSSVGETSVGEARANLFQVFARSSSFSLNEYHALLHAGANAFETAENVSGDARNEELSANYLARNCEFLTAGKGAARVAVLWPKSSLHAHHHPRAHRFVRWVEEDLAATMQLLNSLHFDYSFVAESEIVDAEIANRVLVVGAKMPIECMVLPSITCLSRAAWQKLEAFAQAGGKVVCLGLLPRWSEAGRDEKFEREIETQTRTNVEDVYNFYKHEEHESLNELHQSDPSSVGYPVVRQTASGGRISTYQPRLNPDRDDARLRARGLLTESVAPELETQNAATRHRVRVYNEDMRFWTWHDDALSGRVHLLIRPVSPAILPVTSQNEVSLSRFNLWRDSGRDLGNNSSTRSSISTEESVAISTNEAVAVWMTMPANESGGVAWTQEYAGDEVQAFVLNPTTALHLESATFVVETFDGQFARGYATQSGAPSVAWRDGGKGDGGKGDSGRLQRHFGAMAHVPPPILLGDEWDVKENDSHYEYSMRVSLPAEWREVSPATFRVWLQVVPTSETVAIAVALNQVASNEVAADKNATRRFAAPWIFEIEFAPQNSEIEIVMQVWTRDRNEDVAAPVARLAAYPRVEIETSGDKQTQSVSDGLDAKV